MKTIWCYLLVLLIIFMVTVLSAAQQDVCPPWFIPDNSSSTGCSCHYYHAVKCGVDFSLLQFGFCMTYNSTTENTEYGPCPYVAHYSSTSLDSMFLKLPDNVSLLNDFMCGPLNREGTLCRKCKDGYGTAIYSYTLECRKCWGHGYGWVLYYFLELFPVTVLYFLVVIFHVRATSSPLSALVFMSQVMVYTVCLNVPLHMYIENEVKGFPYVVLQVILVLHSMWSLDSFHYTTGKYTLVSIMSTHRIGRFSHPAAQPEEFPPEAQWMDYDTLEEVLTLI